jgi:hypothetical protein
MICTDLISHIWKSVSNPMYAGSMHAAAIAMAWHEWREGFALPCLLGQCTDVTWCKQLARISGNRGFRSSNLNAFCWLDSAWCMPIHCIVLFVYIMMSMHTRTTMCICLLLNCTLADGCARQYSVPVFHIVTGSSDCTFDNNYTQNHHPVPFLCPWLRLCLTVVDIKFAVKQISQF